MGSNSWQKCEKNMWHCHVKGFKSLNLDSLAPAWQHCSVHTTYWTIVVSRTVLYCIAGQQNCAISPSRLVSLIHHEWSIQNMLLTVEGQRYTYISVSLKVIQKRSRSMTIICINLKAVACVCNAWLLHQMCTMYIQQCKPTSIKDLKNDICTIVLYTNN